MSVILYIMCRRSSQPWHKTDLDT